MPSLPEFNMGFLFAILYPIALIAIAGWWWQVSARETATADNIKKTTAELAVLKDKVGQAGKIRDQVAELKKRIEAIQELTKAQTRPVVLFDSLADVIPRDLWLTGLEERGNTLRITGTSFSTTAVADFMSNLRASNRFKDVDLVVSRQDITKTPRMVTFEVTCRFES
jgi:type IV pilus assembly protein PilN